MPNAHNVHVICDSKSEETSSSSPKLLSGNKEMITLLNSYRVPVKHHGRHFGRAIYAFCNVKSLVINGLDHLGNDPDIEPLTVR
jgi:hypothetical protein